MSQLLRGKTVFITGGGSGIGRETAIAMAEEGAKIAVTDLNGKAAQQAVELIIKAGGEAFAVALDVTDKNAVDRCVDDVVARWGRLDIAFNNAGIVMEDVGSVWDDLASIDKTMDVNYRAVLLCMSAELRHMVAAGSGSIVSTASIAGVTGIGGAGYCASKHAVVGLTRSAALRYASQNVRVNAVCPGVIETAMTKPYLDTPEGAKALAALVPMGRFGTPRDIANAVVFLSSDRASFITGTTMMVDGGKMAA